MIRKPFTVENYVRAHFIFATMITLVTIMTMCKVDELQVKLDHALRHPIQIELQQPNVDNSRAIWI